MLARVGRGVAREVARQSQGIVEAAGVGLVDRPRGAAADQETLDRGRSGFEQAAAHEALEPDADHHDAAAPSGRRQVLDDGAIVGERLLVAGQRERLGRTARARRERLADRLVADRRLAHRRATEHVDRDRVGLSLSDRRYLVGDVGGVVAAETQQTSFGDADVVAVGDDRDRGRDDTHGEQQREQRRPESGRAHTSREGRATGTRDVTALDRGHALDSRRPQRRVQPGARRRPTRPTCRTRSRSRPGGASRSAASRPRGAAGRSRPTCRRAPPCAPRAWRRSRCAAGRGS